VTSGVNRPRVVVVGAGFGGLSAVRGLRRAPVDTLVVDRHNYHLFTPLLYQVASALLDPSEIARPARALLRRIGNADLRVARVEGVDLEARRLHTSAAPVEYDYLVLAAGSVDNFFGIEGVEERGFSLKDLGGALALRNRVLRQFERAMWTDDANQRRRLLSFAIVGGGPTGVEFAGALSELIALVLRKDFPNLDIGAVRIALVEAGDGLLAAFAPRLRRAAQRALERKGVEVRVRTSVTRADETGLLLADGTHVEAGTVIWTAGVYGADLAGAVVARPASARRVAVGPTLQLAEHPEVFVIGDLAEVQQDGAPLPMLIPVAMQEGEHVARSIAAMTAGQALQPFRYHDPGIMATIGRNSGVAQVGPFKLSGFIGWCAWLGLHLIKIIGFRNRLIVLINWGWEYFRYDRPVRLIAAPRGAPDTAPPDGL